MTPAYPLLSVEDFGRQLIVTGDLDPVYIALTGVEWPEDQKKRWLLAYWLFYHPGAACYMCEGEGKFYWNRLLNAAKNEVESPIGGRWPRASERRHFRGSKAVNAVLEIEARFGTAEALVDLLVERAPSYDRIAQHVKTLPMCGDWISFKIADMIDRCLGVPVNFSLDNITMFEDPRKGALMVAREKFGLVPTARFLDEPDTIRKVMEHLIRTFSDLEAPPYNDRQIGYQEAETVVCKWKSHVNGHYPVGKDIVEIREGLTSWAEVSEAAREFLYCMPKLTQD